MAEIIERDGDIITIKSEVTRVIDLGKLRDELEALKGTPKPSDEEVLVLAKQGMTHVYYEDQQRIVELEEEIEKWQSL
jgi:hypothetical protein